MKNFKPIGIIVNKYQMGTDRNGIQLVDHYIVSDNTQVQKPVVMTPIERTDESGQLWSNMSTEDRAKLNIRQGRNPYTSRPLARGNLNNVYPEFDVFTGIRSLYTMPKGFLKGTGRMSIKQDSYYRQINKADKGIEHAKSAGVITTKDTKIPEIRTKGFSLRKQTFEVPFFSKNNLWYGRNPKYDVIVGKDIPGIEWMPITKRGGFRPDVKDIEEAYVRTTPLVHGKPNIAPASQFEYYRHYPIIGYRNVTNGFPHLPITGLSPLFNDD